MTQPPRDTTLFTANQILVRLKARVGLIILTACLTVLAVAAIVAIVPRAYTSSTDIYVDYRENDPISGFRLSAMLDDSYMRTQLELIRSRVVTERVIELLDLKQTAAYREAALTLGEGEANGRWLARINGNTGVTTATNSRVITVSYTAADPAQARRFADAIIEAYLQISREMTLRGATLRTEQYRAQLRTLREDAEAAQSELTRYQQETGILTTQANTDAEMQRLESLQATRTDLLNRDAAARARVESWRRQVDSGTLARELPEIGRLPQMIELQARQADAAARLADQRPELGPNHPRVQSLQAEVATLSRMQAEEAQAILQAQSADVDDLTEQIRSLDERIAEQRELVLQRMQQRDRVAALQRQLESADQIYRSALDNYDSLVLAGNITPHNVTVLRPADLPSQPSRPRVTQSLIASLIVGLFLGLCLALLIELVQRRLRCLDDLERTLDQPILGQIGRSDSRLVRRRA